ncbi:hypothetical protein [Clostridium perfringens]|uniref:hypothetical protein n=2 Tax=Clostridium perfringens TaxID=1502 RepID=UPI001B824C66|nr:hypothetical protein [Clostridium perfringens]HBC2035047.1 hypothetical protein [Clostridium perfringens]HBC2058210.1 hypothetical protein [Clostridium perfringens]HBC2072365.1 hypothetical protein [Clostridium perfringens]
MKISKTFSLEEDVLDKIINYQKSKNLSSASAALERIILIELAKRDDIEQITETMKELLKNSNINTSNIEVVNRELIKNTQLDKSVLSSYESMPE